MRRCGSLPTSSKAILSSASVDSASPGIRKVRMRLSDWSTITNKESEMKNDKNTKVVERVADAAALTGIGAAATGATAAAVGVTTTVTTAGMSAAAVTGAGAAIGGTIGGVTGGVVGAGVGIASGGTAIVGTIPLAAAGATTGASVGGAVATTVAGWLGIPIATTTTVVTAPAWAIPVAVVGGMAAIGAIGYRLYRRCIAAKLQPILVDAHEIASGTGTVVVG